MQDYFSIAVWDKFDILIFCANMVGETFFTTIGCMDGRCQEVVDRYGRDHFNALYPDTITEAGIVGILAHEPTPDFLDHLRTKILISLEKHHSKGIVVDGHAECAGNPVDDATHQENVRKAVAIIADMVDHKVPVVGVYIHRSQIDQSKWEASEVSTHSIAA